MDTTTAATASGFKTRAQRKSLYRNLYEALRQFRDLSSAPLFDPCAQPPLADMAQVKHYMTTLFPEFEGITKPEDLIKACAKKLCSSTHVKLSEEFKIFNECRMVMNFVFDDELDIELICHWGKFIHQDEQGRFYLR